MEDDRLISKERGRQLANQLGKTHERLIFFQCSVATTYNWNSAFKFQVLNFSKQVRKITSM